MSTRELSYSDGSSNKFWKIDLSGKSHTVVFGKIGTAGQTKTKDFGSDAEARKSFDKLIEQKLKKGYTDSGSSSGTSTPAKKTTKKATASKASKAAATKTSKAVASKSSTLKKKAVATPKDAPPEFDLSVTHDLGLDEMVLRRSHYHDLPPLKPSKEEVTLEQAMEDFLKNVKVEQYGWDLNFKNVPLTYPMSKPVAHFWFCMMARDTRIDGKNGLKKFFAASQKKHKFDGKLKKATVKKFLEADSGRIADEIALPLASLFSPEECLELMLKPLNIKVNHYGFPSGQRNLIVGFHNHLVPRLSEAEKKKLRARVKKTFDPKAEPPSEYTPFPPEHYAAAALGMHNEISKIVCSWDDDRFSGAASYYAVRELIEFLVAGVKTREEYETHWRRLKLTLYDIDVIFSLIANTGLSGLDLVADYVCAQTNKDEAAAGMAVLAKIRAPEAAEPILQCRLNSKASGAAREWMRFNVGNCVAGLIEIAGQRGKLGDAAIEYYREIKRAGHADLIAKYVKKAGKKSAGATRIQTEVLDREEKVYQPFDDKTTPKWLKEKFAQVEFKKPPKLPEWAAAKSVAPLTIGDRMFNEEQIETVLKVLAATPIEEKAPLLEALKEHIDASVRDQFAWQLFESWLEYGANSKTKWAMGAIGHLGDDGCVVKLTPLVRAWPGESQHQRAVYGLQCLRGVGSDTALMQLSGMAQKLKFKGLKQKAALFVDEIAKEKGMTRAELEDRVIPDCGLDEMGRREISFGTRKFDFVLGGDLKPMVRDDKGKVRPNPPKPGVNDDAKIANESLAQWKLAKKQIKEVAVLQSARLEQAMVCARRWSVDDFETLLVRHPLMTHLVQKLIWGSFDKNGKRQALFRVTEERDYADAADNAVTLAKANAVGIVHPLELNEKEKAPWGEILGDYEIISPFPQLGRSVYAIEVAEKKATELKRFHGIKLYAPTLVFTLEKLGWIRGEAMDGGCFDELSKQFPAYGVTAVVGFEGIVGMGYIEPEEMLTTETVHFCKGMRKPSGYRWDKSKKFKLGEVPELVASEVMADLNILQSKAK